jgi:hypothetical protein
MNERLRLAVERIAVVAQEVEQMEAEAQNGMAAKIETLATQLEWERLFHIASAVPSREPASENTPVQRLT